MVEKRIFIEFNSNYRASLSFLTEIANKSVFF
jgi:hypothetical protein